MAALCEKIESRVMVEIKAVSIDSNVANELLLVLKSEWPDLEKFVDFHRGMNLPEPIAAIESGEIIGGLSYINYKAPDQDKVVLWINAVFVRPSYRGQGIATAMLKTAMKTTSCMYALTDVPDLYTNLGFKRVLTDNHGTVVKFTIT